jgi:hypothetical protein
VSRRRDRFFIFHFSILNLRASLLALFCSLLLTGCFQEAVKETMEIVFQRDGTATLRVDVEVANEGATPEMTQRLEELRGEMLDGRDAWSHRFERLHPKDESYSWDKVDGKLWRTTHIARVNPDDLGNIFYDSAVQIRYHEERGFAELSIFTGASQRATRDQIRQYNDAADEWSHAVTRYYVALDELYRYTESYPDRAEGMFTVVFAALDDGERPKGDPAAAAAEGATEDRGEGESDAGNGITEEERDLAMKVVKGLEEVVETGGWAGGRDLSADELARLVNDPFPAALAIRFEGEIEEVEGFVPDGDEHGVKVEQKGLIEALAAMRGRWASPDPFHELIDRAAAGENAPPISVAAFLAKPRSSSPPHDWREVRVALDKELKPLGTYRVKWEFRRPPK